MDTKDLNPKHWTPRVILGILFIALLYHWDYTSKYLAGLLSGLRPVLTALLLSLLLYAPLRFFDRHMAAWRLSKKWPVKLRQALSYLLVALLLLLVLYLLGRFIIPMVVSMLTELIGFLRRTDLLDQLRSALNIPPEQWESTVGTYITRLGDLIQSYARDLLSALTSVTASALSFLLYVVLAFYFLAGRVSIRRHLSRVFKALLNPHRAGIVLRTARLAANTVTRWFGFQCLEALILGAETFVGMSIFRMPYAAPLACLVAFMQMIPYLGGWISFIVGFLTMLTVSLNTAIIFAVMLFILQQVEGMVVNPHLVGGAVGLPAYLSLAAVITGSALFGVTGMFLSVPLCSVIYTLGKEFIRKKEHTKKAPPPAEAKEASDADSVPGPQ